MVSHGERWRDSCPARGVTHLAIGSSDWLGVISFDKWENPLASPDQSMAKLDQPFSYRPGERGF